MGLYGAFCGFIGTLSSNLQQNYAQNYAQNYNCATHLYVRPLIIVQHLLGTGMQAGSVLCFLALSANQEGLLNSSSLFSCSSALTCLVIVHGTAIGHFEDIWQNSHIVPVAAWCPAHVSAGTNKRFMHVQTHAPRKQLRGNKATPGAWLLRLAL